MALTEHEIAEAVEKARRLVGLDNREINGADIRVYEFLRVQGPEFARALLALHERVTELEAERDHLKKLVTIVHEGMQP